MKPYVKTYFDYFGYDNSSFIQCICGQKAVNIHHISPRGMGGSKEKDNIENLIALCMNCHHEADFGTKLSKKYLFNKQKEKMETI